MLAGRSSLVWFGMFDGGLLGFKYKPQSPAPVAINLLNLTLWLGPMEAILSLESAFILQLYLADSQRPNGRTSIFKQPCF